MNQIAYLLTQIAEGIDPTTGEIFEVKEHVDNAEIKKAIVQLKRTYTTPKSKYVIFEKNYPGYVIIMKEGFFYSAHNKSAEILNEILDYRLCEDIWGRVSTGGPDVEKIAKALYEEKKKFVIIVKGNILCIYDEDNPYRGVPADMLETE